MPKLTLGAVACLLERWGLGLEIPEVLKRLHSDVDVAWRRESYFGV